MLKVLHHLLPPKPQHVIQLCKARGIHTINVIRDRRAPAPLHERKPSVMELTERRRADRPAARTDRRAGAPQLIPFALSIPIKYPAGRTGTRPFRGSRAWALTW